MRSHVDIPGLPEQFEPRRYLYRGSAGDVVEAFDRKLNMLVALKILRAEGSHETVTRELFRRETSALKGLSHDAIVQILDSFELEDLLCIELELVHGGKTLAALLEDVRCGRIAPPDMAWRLRTIDRLADAVTEAHRRNVIHRDLKPGNVLWNRDEEEDQLKLADFGIALVLPLTVRDPGGTTLRSFFTPPYASPEQLLQRQVTFASDIYSFSLLASAVLALKEPGNDFQTNQLPELLRDAAELLRTGGVPASTVDELAGALSRSLEDEPRRRPSLNELRELIKANLSAFIPRPEASLSLTKKANERLAQLGFSSPAKIAEDFANDLRARLEQDEKGEVIRIYGATLFAILRPNVDELRMVDAGQNAGPLHEYQRGNAEACNVRVLIKQGSGRALLDFAREAHRVHTRRATNELLEHARTIVRIERERLPYFAIECTVEGGHDLRRGRREERIGQASGYRGASTDKVELQGGFLLVVKEAWRAQAPLKRNVVSERLASIDDVEGYDSFADADWYSLFDDPKDVDILDDHGHMIGKVTGYDRKTNTVHVKTDKKRVVLRSGTFYVKSQQKERQLRQQEIAIETLARGDTVRADMPALLSESSVHQLGDLPWLDLMQEGLHPKERVRELVNRMLASRSIFCLQGPPGTGKTTLIAEVVAQFLDIDPRMRILVCSQANEAVANAIERIRRVRSELARDWLIVRDVRDDVAKREGTWSGFEQSYVEFKERVSRNAVEAMATLNPGVRPAIEEWLQRVDHRSQHVERDYRRLVQVWGATTARSTGPLRDVDVAYDLVIIDEAAKATIGEVLVPIVHARRVLLVGDHLQLPPFLEDTTRQALQEIGISEQQAKYTLFEHLLALLPADHQDMLDVQFRMHPTIGDLISKLFYKSKLKNGPGTNDRPLPAGDFSRSHRVLWLDVRGHDYKVGKTSRANDQERQAIERTLEKLDRDATKDGWSREDRPLMVAVIAAYRGQADLLERDLKRREKHWKALRVKAATVDAFQGREADVVLYSLVRTGDAKRDFIADGRRFNVALSRARSLLILIGDKNGALGTERLKELLEMIPPENQISVEDFDRTAKR